MKKNYNLTIDDVLTAFMSEGSKNPAARKLNTSPEFIIRTLKNAGYDPDVLIPEKKKKQMIIEKRQSTNMIKYGCKEGWNTNTQKQTMEKHYGVSNPFAAKDVIKKIQLTNYQRYGVKNPAMTFEARKKASDALKERTLKKYGVVNPFQIPAVKEKIAKKKEANNSYCKSLKARHSVYSKKELSLNCKLSKLGFKHNDFDVCFKFDSARKYPDYVNQEKHLVLEFNGTYFHRNDILSAYGIIQPDIAQLRRWYNGYAEYGYQLLVIQEKDYDMFMSREWTLDELILAFLWEPKYDFYVAGPFFKPEQLESMSKLEAILEDHGFKMFRPRKDAGQIDMKTSTDTEMASTFNNDLEGICNSKIIFANMTYLDTGTAFELGYASSSKIASYLLVDFNTAKRPVNLMLAKTVNQIFTSYDEVKDWFDNAKSLDLDAQLKNKLEVE